MPLAINNKFEFGQRVQTPVSEGIVTALLVHMVSSQPEYLVRLNTQQGEIREALFAENQLTLIEGAKKAPAKVAEKPAVKTDEKDTDDRDTDAEEAPKTAKAPAPKKEAAKKPIEKVEAVKEDAGGEDLRKKASDLVIKLGRTKGKGAEAIRRVFEPFGAGSISELKQEQFADFIDAIEIELLS